MGIKVKICGLRRLEDVCYVNQYQPDYIGFVFAKSKRQVTVQQAEILSKELSPNIIRVGVFVNQPIEEVEDLMNRGIIHYAQLHGDEDQLYINELYSKIIKTNHSINANQIINSTRIDNNSQQGIIKAIRVKDESDIARANTYECDYLLLDTYCVECEGGNGKAFDWSIITRMNKPFFLAGGINVDNVNEAITLVKPYGVDASSSLETDGYKDIHKIQRFIQQARKETDGYVRER